jgi:hypothetical protein
MRCPLAAPPVSALTIAFTCHLIQGFQICDTVNRENRELLRCSRKKEPGLLAGQELS